MSANALGCYLREKRSHLDPAAFGYTGRRRTSGLRREEVAQRARISTTWYSFLEQGRGGMPSAQVLDRIADALLLTHPEREHAFLLGLGRTPDVRYHAPKGVSVRLQGVLDAMETCPAIIRTATWDVIAWNRAATVVFADYGALGTGSRNLIRRLFLDPYTRATDPDWDANARFIVGVFRGEIARAGAAMDAMPMVDALRADSAEFAAMWRDSTVNGACDAIRRQNHPTLGNLAFHFSSFAVDGRPDLAMLVHTPVSKEQGEWIKAFTFS